MKDGVGEIVGKSIAGIVVAENNRPPRVQLFLTFADGTYFEIWGDNFTCAGGVDRGDAETAAAYAKSFGARITKTFPNPNAAGVI